MDLNTLVHNVVEDVLKQLQAVSSQPRVMVLARHEAALEERLTGLLDPHVRLLFVGDNPEQEVGRYILPRLSCSEMADLALGRAESSPLRQVLKLLLTGTEIEVLDFEYIEYSETAPGPLYRLYLSYFETLKGYGLVPLRKRRPDFVRCWEEVITEKVIETAAESGAISLQVLRRAKVTPLAAETAKRIGLALLRCL